MPLRCRVFRVRHRHCPVLRRSIDVASENARSTVHAALRHAVPYSTLQCSAEVARYEQWCDRACTVQCCEVLVCTVSVLAPNPVRCGSACLVVRFAARISLVDASKAVSCDVRGPWSILPLSPAPLPAFFALAMWYHSDGFDIQYSTVQRTARHCTVQHSAVQCSAVQYRVPGTVQYSTLAAVAAVAARPHQYTAQA